MSHHLSLSYLIEMEQQGSSSCEKCFDKSSITIEFVISVSQSQKMFYQTNYFAKLLINFKFLIKETKPNY